MKRRTRKRAALEKKAPRGDLSRLASLATRNESLLAGYSLSTIRFFFFVSFFSQNTRDIQTDRKAGIKTLAVLVGQQASCYLHAFFLLFPYVVIVLLGAALSPFIYIPSATLPFALSLSVSCFEGEHFTLPQKIAVLDLAFGILYVLSVCWS